MNLLCLCWVENLFPSHQYFPIVQDILRLVKCAVPWQEPAKSKGFNVRSKSAEAEKCWELHLYGFGNWLLSGAGHQTEKEGEKGKGPCFWRKHALVKNYTWESIHQFFISWSGQVRKSEYQPLHLRLAHQLASTQTPPLGSSCCTATCLRCYRRQCKPLLVLQPNVSCSSSYSHCASSHPSQLRAYLITRKQRPAPLLGEESCSPLRVHTILTESGRAAPHACCSGPAALAVFLPAAAICLFTIACVLAAAKAFDQNWAGHHTHSKDKTHSTELNICKKTTSKDWEYLEQHQHVPSR